MAGRTVTEQDRKEQVQKLNAQKEKQKAAAAALESDPAAQKDVARKLAAGTPDLSDDDKQYVIIKVTNKHVNNDTKEILNESRVIKVWPRMMKQMIEGGGFSQFDEATIIHDPRPEAEKALGLKPPARGPEGTTVGVNSAERAELAQKSATLDAEIEKAKALNARMEASLAASEVNKKVNPPADLGATDKDAQGPAKQ